MQILRACLMAAVVSMAVCPQGYGDSAGSAPNGGDEVTVRVLEKLQQRGLVAAEDVEALNRQPAADAERQPGPATAPPGQVTGTTEGAANTAAASTAANSAANAIPGAILATVAIVALFSAPVLIVGLVSINNYRRRKLLHDNINKLIEQGRDLPPALLEHFERSPNRRNDLEKGVKYIALGLGIGISLALISTLSMGSLGLIPLFMGLAHLLIWKLDQLPTGSAP